MEIPTVFFDVDRKWYNDWIISNAAKQARHFGHDVYLLSDQNTADVNHVRLEKIESNKTKEFCSKYIHLSENESKGPYYSMVRWFYLLDFMKFADKNLVLFSDSDVLFYCPPETIMNDKKFIDEIGVLGGSGGYTGATSVWNKNTLEDFCNYLLDCYTNQLEYLKSVFKDQHNISDMFLLTRFLKSDKSPKYSLLNFRNGVLIDNSNIVRYRTYYFDDDSQPRIIDGRKIGLLHYQGIHKYSIFLDRMFDDQKFQVLESVYFLIYYLRYLTRKISYR